MKRIELRTRSDGSTEVWVDDINPGGRATQVGTLYPNVDNVPRAVALITDVALALNTQVKVR